MRQIWNTRRFPVVGSYDDELKNTAIWAAVEYLRSRANRRERAKERIVNIFCLVGIGLILLIGFILVGSPR